MCMSYKHYITYSYAKLYITLIHNIFYIIYKYIVHYLFSFCLLKVFFFLPPALHADQCYFCHLNHEQSATKCAFVAFMNYGSSEENSTQLCNMDSYLTYLEQRLLLDI